MSPSDENATEAWEFAGWGQSLRITNLDSDPLPVKLALKTPKKLGVWRSTAICGNDITSSCS